MNETTYRELFEKYARREKIRAITAIVTGITGAISTIGAIMALRQLRDDRRAVQLATQLAATRQNGARTP
jgi:hypothetical protein